MDISEAEDLLMRLQLVCIRLTHAVNSSRHGSKAAELELERVVKKLYKGLIGEAPSDEAVARITNW